MDEIAISKFKATCLAVLERVRRTGQPIRVTRFGKPVAEIVPPAPPKAQGSWIGSMVGTGEILGDIVAPASDESDWEVLRD
jgi:prevent-host-death family protein